MDITQPVEARNRRCLLKIGGRYWIRTSNFHRVRVDPLMQLRIAALEIPHRGSCRGIALDTVHPVGVQARRDQAGIDLAVGVEGPDERTRAYRHEAPGLGRCRGGARSRGGTEGAAYRAI